ncbi:MAG: selenide, water dikinase SelD [Gammaproteobacteria bacterium]|nr:selenide, water dikinase SelD [Gammaproteobacteria bacterium]
MKSEHPYLRDLLLIGGGHAHVQVIRRFGMKPEPGVRLTLVSRESATPYTGMLPGFISGEYQQSEIVIDLLRLSRFANCRFIEANVERVDALEQRAFLGGGRPPLRYDALSINSGGDCTLDIPGGEFVEPVKPIGRFLRNWSSTFTSLTSISKPHIAIIGGGPGSVELALALRHRLGDESEISLISRANVLMPDHGRIARRHVETELQNHRVHVVCNFNVVAISREVDSGELVVSNEDGTGIGCQYAFSATGVGAPSWLRKSGFIVDDQGFVKVNRYLQAETFVNIFAAGDVAALNQQPRPKSGVYSVREGPYLAENLRRYLTGHRLKRFNAQRRALALVRTAPGRATASRGLLQVSGGWLWRYKDWIDRRFMRRFQDLPVMVESKPIYRGELATEAPETSMRCGGCGAKLGADLLQRVLHRLDIHSPESVFMGVGEDAAVVNMGSATMAISCDGFRAMVDDPWRFGRIAAHHALNDLYAMNSEPSVAIALVTVPFMSENLMEEDLFHLMSGALTVFDESDVALVGGHTAEGAELSVGFTVAGSTSFNVMAKGNLLPNQALVLTKPIGVGTLLAGGMDGRCDAHAVETALRVMDRSNAAGMQIFADYDVTACTDVTGFGLGGHLGEMLRASEVSASLKLDAIPILPEAIEALLNGVESSLQKNNEQIFDDCSYDCSSLDPRLRMLADPQTSGGLLAGVDRDYVDSCLHDLRRFGYAAAQVIGAVDTNTTRVGQITIQS